MSNNRKTTATAAKAANTVVETAVVVVESTKPAAVAVATPSVNFKRVQPVEIPQKVVTRQSKCVTILPGQLADLAAIIIAANEKLGILNPDGTARIKHKIIFETEPSGKKEKKSAIKSIVMSAEAEDNEIPTPMPDSSGDSIEDAVAAGNDNSFHQEEEE